MPSGDRAAPAAGPAATPNPSGMGLRRVQRRRKLVVLVSVIAAVALAMVTRSAASAGAAMHESMEFLGLFLIVACILGRTWTAIYIGGSKRVLVVDIGPYSVMRNPLYVFSILGAAGVGLSSGTATLGIAFGAIAFVLFHVVVLSEEAFLTGKFGAVYTDYMARAPRWLPRLSAWKDEDVVSMRPARVVRTFVEASLFLVAFPVFEGVEALQNAGVLPVLLELR